MSAEAKVRINVPLIQRLIRVQFPQWADLKIKPVETSGWDNRTFHLGEHMTVRLPSSAEYATQVEKEHHWLPKLSDHLPLAIPKPIAMGHPTSAYPWHWSVYQWLEGKTATIDRIDDLNLFAVRLAEFINALQQCDATGGPVAGPDNFYRGGPVSIYDADTRKAFALLDDNQLAHTLTTIWEKALESTWQNNPIWVHGDIAVGNLLVTNGQLSAVIDFGQLAIGDPACDLAIALSFFKGESRETFRRVLNLDNDTWHRARGWVLWKTLCAPIAGTDCKRGIDEIIADFSWEGK